MIMMMMMMMIMMMMMMMMMMKGTLQSGQRELMIDAAAGDG